MTLADKLTKLNSLQKNMDSWPVPEGEAFAGKTYIADGWSYKDLPRMSQDHMDKFKLVVGEENIKWITFAKYPNGETRGQLLISPLGLNRLQGYLEAQKED